MTSMTSEQIITQYTDYSKSVVSHVGGDDGNEKWDDMILSQSYLLPLYIIIFPT